MRFSDDPILETGLFSCSFMCFWADHLRKVGETWRKKASIKKHLAPNKNRKVISYTKIGIVFFFVCFSGGYKIRPLGQLGPVSDLGGDTWSTTWWRSRLFARPGRHLIRAEFFFTCFWSAPSQETCRKPMETLPWIGDLIEISQVGKRQRSLGKIKNRLFRWIFPALNPPFTLW